MRRMKLLRKFDHSSDLASSATRKRARQRPVLLAIASGGGHFAELAQIREAFAGYDIRFATTVKGLAESFGVSAYKLIPDCNRNTGLAAARAFVRVSILVLRVRPDVLVTTGALPGLMALVVAKRIGTRTVWIDSVANAEEVSLSGQYARRHADVCLTQWPHLADSESIAYWGSLL